MQFSDRQCLQKSAECMKAIKDQNGIAVFSRWIPLRSLRRNAVKKLMYQKRVRWTGLQFAPMSRNMVCAIPTQWQWRQRQPLQTLQALCQQLNRFIRDCRNSRGNPNKIQRSFSD